MLKEKLTVRKTTKKPATRSKPVAHAAAKAPKLPSSKKDNIPQSPKVSSVSMPVVGVDNKPTGKVALPGALFAVKVNKTLLAQAVRVHLANQREGSASTKTRGEVEGSTRKIYRQKGTGRARHGAIRAPIFVGGGIVFGPRPRDYHLDFPKKMKRAALASALTSRQREGNILIVDGFSSLPPKTKAIHAALQNLGASQFSLLVVSKASDTVVRAGRNLPYLTVVLGQNLNPYDVLRHKKIVMMKESVPTIVETFTRQ